MTDTVKHMKPTPGPWKIISGARIASRDTTIADIRKFTDGEGKANAELIAAAPDVAEALQAIATIDHNLGTFSGSQLLAECKIKAEAALAKAGIHD